jgi:hypothetical protein
MAEFIIGAAAGTLATIIAIAAANYPRVAFTTVHGVRVRFRGLAPWFTESQVHEAMIDCGGALIEAGVCTAESVARALVGLRITFLAGPIRDRDGSPSYGQVMTSGYECHLSCWAPPPIGIGRSVFRLLFASRVALTMGLPINTPTSDLRWARALGLAAAQRAEAQP